MRLPIVSLALALVLLFAPAAQAQEAPVLQALLPGDVFGRAVALTFDDGPHPVYTPLVLEALKRTGASATFFVTGRRAQQHPALIRRIVEEGHVLGNHSFDHPHLPTLDREAIAAQLETTHWAVDKALGRHYDLTLVRAPYGAENEALQQLCAERGERLVLWNAHARNVFTGKRAPVLYPRGGPILFHDPAPLDWALVAGIVRRLQADGVAIVPLDELFERKYALARAVTPTDKLRQAAAQSRAKARRPRR